MFENCLFSHVIESLKEKSGFICLDCPQQISKIMKAKRFEDKRLKKKKILVQLNKI